MRICVDFDHTICETSKAILKTYNDFYGDNIEYNENHDWDLTGLVPDIYKKWCLDQFNKEVLYNNIQPIKDAVEVLSELSKKHEIIIVTHHTGIGMYYKEEVIKRFFPFCSIVFTSSFNKGITFGDIFIDDKIECLESVKENYKYIWCFGNYNWNKEWTGERFIDWKEIYEKIQKIS